MASQASSIELTPNDFGFVYINTRGYPRLVNWVTESPLTYGDMQVTVTVLQRQMDAESDEEFIVSLRPTSKSLSMSDDDFGEDPYTQEGGMLVGTAPSFEEACIMAIAGVGELRARYQV
ncbi:MAG: hypothetical protein BZ138_08440 [Methanosphaera sp. rholeuAM270]|nr:MAG: hypothetical protein BZ138_08440 [Methanosphaera sp. rholeuAM270]